MNTYFFLRFINRFMVWPIWRFYYYIFFRSPSLLLATWILARWMMVNATTMNNTKKNVVPPQSVVSVSCILCHNTFYDDVKICLFIVKPTYTHRRLHRIYTTNKQIPGQRRKKVYVDMRSEWMAFVENMRFHCTIAIWSAGHEDSQFIETYSPLAGHTSTRIGQQKMPSWVKYAVCIAGTANHPTM